MKTPRAFLCFFLICVGQCLSAVAQKLPAPEPQPCTYARDHKVTVSDADKDVKVPLAYLIPCIQDLLGHAQDQLAEDSKGKPVGEAPPPLSTVEFDFQTVKTTDTVANLGIASVFTTGVERKAKATSESDFTYSVPQPKDKALYKASIFPKWLKQLFARWDAPQEEEKSLAQTLPEAIVAAVKAVEQNPLVKGPSGEKLSHRKIVITVAFEVDKTFNNDLDFTKILVVGPEVKYNPERDDVQTVKLTFEDIDKPAGT